MKKLLLILVLCCVGCEKPVSQGEVLPTPDVANARLSFTADLAPSGYDRVYIIRDKDTGQEYLWVTGVQATSVCPMAPVKAEQE